MISSGLIFQLATNNPHKRHFIKPYIVYIAYVRGAWLSFPNVADSHKLSNGLFRVVWLIKGSLV